MPARSWMLYTTAWGCAVLFLIVRRLHMPRVQVLTKVMLSPTYQNHRPVLHVLQLSNAGVLGLLVFYSHADNIQ